MSVSAYDQIFVIQCHDLIGSDGSGSAGHYQTEFKKNIEVINRVRFFTNQSLSIPEGRVPAATSPVFPSSIHMKQQFLKGLPFGASLRSSASLSR